MTHIMKIDEFVNENFNSVNDNQINNFIKNHKVAFDYFVELCKDEENYPEVEDVIDALRSLGTNNDITDEEYNFLVTNFDAVWSYYLSHPDKYLNESAMMKNQYGVYGGYHCVYIAFTSEVDERRLKLDRSFPTLEEAVDYAAKIEADCIYSYTLAAELCDIFGYQNIEDMLDCGVLLFNPYSGSADVIGNIKEYNDLVKYVNAQYNEVRIDNFDENENVWTVDAWKTSDDNEEGTVVAKISENGEVVFTDLSAQNDKLVNETIDEFIKNELHTTRK